MFIGHFGLAFGARRLAPRTSLGTLFLAAQWLDLVWPTLLLLGIERVLIDPALPGLTPLLFVHYPYTHSLVAALGWALLLGGAYFALTRYARGAWVVGALVASHWLLDAIVHRADLPLTVGGAARIGMGLWQSAPAAAIGVEVLLFIAGVALFWRALGRGASRGQRIGTALLVAFLVLIHLGNLTGPPPPSVQAIAWVGQAQWLLVLAAYAIDRRPRAPLAPLPAH
ncbi:MAG: hypothetical protein MUC86_09050 [Burkholderiaceae bacterium]|jgi:membrane-bound metal-dependent hydrolase YbcI (DUF457 family)|nr:hypothetical protein [Burkholderiaceae bacterium]